MQKRKTIVRDISWLAFNNRVLQEAADITVPLRERIRFLGIVSNNLDEFFRVRVATLKKMLELGNKAKMHLEHKPEVILKEIEEIVNRQQVEFERIWKEIQAELAKLKIFLVNDKKLNPAQQKFVTNYFNEEVRSYMVPLMIENIQTFPVLNDKSIYLACKLSRKDKSIPQRFALVSVPARRLNRFLILPQKNDEQYIILLEDIIRFCMPFIFSLFNYDQFSAHLIKVTRDAEIDIDNDVATSLIQKIEKGIKSRKSGRPVRFAFDKDIDITLLTYLVKRLGLSLTENLIPGGRIHNFKDFMNFPDEVFPVKNYRKKPFTHPLLKNTHSITELVCKKDVLLNFPYHSFDSVVDLLREAAIDPGVNTIKITCYRLGDRSKVVNALTNAARNGKEVIVVIELRARFDEAANLTWKTELEEAGVKVYIGAPNQKVHAKICLISKQIKKATIQYGFVSTGNLNEKTSQTYGDHCLLTSNKKIMADVDRIFSYYENAKVNIDVLKACTTLLVSPTGMRPLLINLINKEIKNAKHNKEAAITFKINSLSDEELIHKLEEAAREGVKIKLLVRGICCMYTENKKFKYPIQAISIVDEYLEHARVLIFHNDGDEKVYLSSADLMVRNFDHRVEAACPVLDTDIKKEIIDIINIQLGDNVKARILNNDLNNEYVKNDKKKSIRSQVATYQYLINKKYS